MNINRILDNIKKDENDCWIWQKSVNSSGYGQFFENKKYCLTHKYAYEFYNKNSIPKGIVVRHKCHNKRCCNPDHLILGTDKDNYADSKDVHRIADKKKRCNWIVRNIHYPTIRIASKITKLSNSILSKYTNKETRIFDYDSYAKACKIANVEPKTLPTLKTLTKEQKKLIEDNM